MLRMVIPGVFTVLFLLFIPAIQGQTSDDEVDQLRKENELLKKEIELLKKEVELLKKEPGSGAKSAAKSRSVTKVRKAGTRWGEIEFELVSCVRKGAKITFSFSAQCDNNHSALGARGWGLNVTARGGEKVEAKMIGRPGGVSLAKDVPSRFQIVITDVDEDITEFDEVALTPDGQFGFSPVFHGIKIEEKK